MVTRSTLLWFAMLAALLPARALADGPAATIELDHSGPVTVRVESKAAFDTLGLSVTSPVTTTLCADCEGGEHAALGNLPAGTRIDLRLTDGNQSFASNDPAHAHITKTGESWEVDWDDALGDGDFNDLVVTVSGPPVSCPSIGATLPGVVLREDDVAPKVSGKPFEVGYGDLPLTFTVAPPPAGALCSVRSNRGALPVELIVPHTGGAARVHVADSVTTATLDFIPVDAAPPVDCDFSSLHLERAVLFGTHALPDTAQNCFLDPRTSGDLAARWSIPGFVEYALLPGGGSAPVLSTPPLTYWLDLGPYVGRAPFILTSAVLDRIENVIHRMLIANLPAVADMGIVQDPPARVRVVDALGRAAGHGARGARIPGATYHEVAGRSLVWIPQPARGGYEALLTGRAHERYRLAITYLRMRGAAVGGPVVSERTRSGRLSGTGKRTTRFAFAGAHGAPALGRVRRCTVPRLKRVPARRARAALAPSGCRFGGVVRGRYRAGPVVRGYARRAHGRYVRVAGGRHLRRGARLFLRAR